MIDLKNLTIEKAHDALMKGDFSSVDLAKAYMEEIKKKNKDINAYLEVYDDVQEQAKVADAMIKKGEATMLTGIPLIGAIAAMGTLILILINIIPLLIGALIGGLLA